ncbi:MAG TPA: asparaginase [Ilumatobacteraceae bacterium]|jgi:L-asparaginase II
MAAPDGFVPVAITSRNGFDESVHFGAVVGISSSGEVTFALGDPATDVYPRSCNKPMQAVAMLRAGLQLPLDLLALVCASHDGTPAHLDCVRRILATVGFDESALANTPGLPLDEVSAEAVVRNGGGRSPIQMNCSGKHSGMVVTSAINDWPTDADYLDPDHPLQRRITDEIAELTGESPVHIGVDGCGAPAHAFSLLGLARGFRALASGKAGETGQTVYRSMTSYPELVGGQRRDVTMFMRHVPGLVAKDGAEGVFAAALPDGRAVAVKIADGGGRACAPVLVAALRAIGVDTSAVEAHVVQPVMGHGHRVGEVRAIGP